MPITEDGPLVTFEEYTRSRLVMLLR
ncbi:MAG: hypothetical protein JWO57_2189, partial [Pseudonocardiales bacterium]|nr:hypothetical protein [Pseudonocardiales bacterium]